MNICRNVEGAAGRINFHVTDRGKPGGPAAIGGTCISSPPSPSSIQMFKTKIHARTTIRKHNTGTRCTRAGKVGAPPPGGTRHKVFVPEFATNTAPLFGSNATPNGLLNPVAYVQLVAPARLIPPLSLPHPGPPRTHQNPNPSTHMQCVNILAGMTTAATDVIGASRGD